MPRPIQELARWGFAITNQVAPELEIGRKVHDAGGTIILLDQPWLTIPRLSPAL